jgi:hypothetical protein
MLAGPLLGLGIGERVAPDSDFAQSVGMLAFPLAFFGGLLLWMGIGIVRVVWAALRNLSRGGRPAAVRLERGQALVPPGYGAFVALSLLLPGAAGLLAGLASEAAVLTAVPAYTIAGGAYGATLWWLAHHGYLPFPEPE